MPYWKRALWTSVAVLVLVVLIVATPIWIIGLVVYTVINAKVHSQLTS